MRALICLGSTEYSLTGTTKVIYCSCSPNPWLTVRPCSSRSFNAKAPRVSVREISRPCSRLLSGNRPTEALYKRDIYRNSTGYGGVSYFWNSSCSFALRSLRSSCVNACKSELANFKVPKRVLIVDELPRNSMAKVQKNLLRQTYKSLFAKEQKT